MLLEPRDQQGTTESRVQLDSGARLDQQGLWVGLPDLRVLEAMAVLLVSQVLLVTRDAQVPQVLWEVQQAAQVRPVQPA